MAEQSDPPRTMSRQERRHVERLAAKGNDAGNISGKGAGANVVGGAWLPSGT